MIRTLETLDDWIDLAAESIGGRTLIANDEFFAAKENLLRPGPAVFDPARYTDRGKWMDGWETRRRRTPGHDWCIVRLGLPGEVSAVVVDTSHFCGNHPRAAWVDGLTLDEPIAAADLAEHPGWRPIAPRTELAGDQENRLPVDGSGRVTHIRLAIDPDGGVARLRVFGSVQPVWHRAWAGDEPVDVASLALGGRTVACSDAFFSSPIHLLMPGDGRSMADGWETRRRRGPGNDWVVVRLGRRTRLERVVVDTRHFKGNYPAACALAVCDWTGDGNPPHEAVPDETGETRTWHHGETQGDRTNSALDTRTWHPNEKSRVAAMGGRDTRTWHPLVERTALGPDREHVLTFEPSPPVTHVRLDIFPDGGVSRLRLWGRPVEDESA